MNPISSFARSILRQPKRLVRKYEPKLYSHGNEELIIRDFFEDRKNGFFVDIGANHHQVDSTTLYLEKFLGWSGIAVDAVSDFESGYLENRKNTRFFCLCVSDRSGGSVDFYVTEKNYMRRSSLYERWAKKYGKSHRRRIPTIRLDDLLEREGVERIDFLSVDVELGEEAALAGFDIEKYRPALVCIEMHRQVRRPLFDYFSKHGYVLLKKYEGLDPANSYFIPAR
jgi:FkbM family methyltransferase